MSTKVDNTGNQEKKGRFRWVSTVVLFGFIPLGTLAIIIAHIIQPTLKIDAITLGLLIIAILPWLPRLLESAKLPGGWEVTFRRLETKQKQQQSEIDTLKFLVSHFVTEYELRHLRRFVSDQPFLYSGPSKTTPDFEAELRHLRAMRLIDRKPGKNIRVLLQQNNVDVKDYLIILDAGKEYLKLRHQVDSEISA